MCGTKFREIDPKCGSDSRWTESHHFPAAQGRGNGFLVSPIVDGAGGYLNDFCELFGRRQWR